MGYTGRTKPGLRVNPDYGGGGQGNGLKKNNTSLTSQEEPAHRNEEVVRLRREIARNSDRRHTLGISHDVHARKHDKIKVRTYKKVIIIIINKKNLKIAIRFHICVGYICMI